MQENWNLWAVLIISAAIFASVYIYSENIRYYIQTTTSEKGVTVAYKIDRKTGQTWQIVNDKEKLIKDFPDEVQSIQEKTIEMVKKYKSNGLVTVDYHVRELMEETKGNLRIYGWKSREIDDQTYLVSYTFDSDDGLGEAGYFFEVNLVGEIVRSVNADDVLNKKYLNASTK